MDTFKYPLLVLIPRQKFACSAYSWQELSGCDFRINIVNKKADGRGEFGQSNSGVEELICIIGMF